MAFSHHSVPVGRKKSVRKRRGFGHLFFLLLFVAVLLGIYSYSQPFSFDEQVVVQEGDTLYSLLSDQGFVDQLSFRLYLRLGAIDTDFPLQVGKYPRLSGRVSKSQFLNVLAQGPEQSYHSVTLLEGWSIYDVDRFLADTGYISPNDYLSYVRDREEIDGLSDRFGFLQSLSLDSLEGFLYPETYFVSEDGDLVEQLVAMQLESFEERVWTRLSSALQDSGRRFAFWGQDLSSYDVLTLASVVEKEERALSQQSDVAGVLLNRLKNAMRLDADITLCYGLQRGYEFCDPSVIVQYLYDQNNVYNTRQRFGLPPTPISSPTIDAVRAVLEAESHDFLYYLHDPSGVLHLSETLQEHNQKKQRYL